MKKTTGEKIFDVFNVILMIALSITMLYPYINQIAISLNDGMDTILGGITVYPRKFTWVNYRTIFTSDSISRAFFLTVFIAVAHTLTSLFVTTAAAYTMSKKDLPFKNAITWFLIIPMYISGGIIPTFILYRYLGLLNNVLVYIIPGAFSFYNMIIIRTFIKGLPASLEESAMLDGANEAIVLFKIILPLSMPVIATVALWLAVGAWNSWTATLYYVNERSLYTLQYVVMQLIKQSDVLQQLAAETALTGGEMTKEAQTTSESVKAAAIIFSTIPIVLTYPFLQKYFVKGVTIGAVKD
ncbi:MAG: carbohydrate ABC transporter permease [Clostridia bacterium]|nr:carbohydrate ABC transporter permease [Clostridia bacterium]